VSVAGFYVNPTTGNTDGFLLTHTGQFFDLAVSGAFSTMALGVNDHDEVVGVTTPSSNLAELDGITWTPAGRFTAVDDPDGVGTTTINGVNNAGDLVGFYVDGNGNTDGMLATP
jgi:hypothetical protein